MNCVATPIKISLGRVYKLDRIKDGKLDHHGFSVADAPSNRASDFLIGDVAIHVTSAPSEPLIKKCESNLESGLRPLIITTDDGVGGAKASAKTLALEDGIDVIAIDQFLAANLYEWSGFERNARPTSVRELIARYNEIVAECETDPSLRIEFQG
jgi:hypothetical protein